MFWFALSPVKGSGALNVTSSSPGTKRALLRAALGLCCSGEVLEELDRTLGPLPPDQEEPFTVTQVPRGVKCSRILKRKHL
jgi:hypothetical protein